LSKPKNPLPPEAVAEIAAFDESSSIYLKSLEQDFTPPQDEAITDNSYRRRRHLMANKIALALRARSRSAFSTFPEKLTVLQSGGPSPKRHLGKADSADSGAADRGLKTSLNLSLKLGLKSS